MEDVRAILKFLNSVTGVMELRFNETEKTLDKTSLKEGPKVSFKHTTFETSIRHLNEVIKQTFG